MATNSTHSLIAASGGDYTSLSDWHADIGDILGGSTNLITDDYDHYAWIEGEITGNCTITNLTTDNTHKLYIAADSNGGTTAASGHAQTKTDAALMDDDTRALTYNSSYAAIRSASNFQTALTLTNCWADISRLQIKGDGGGNSRTGLGHTGTGTVKLDRCLLFEESGDNATTAAAILAFDDLMYACLWINEGGNYAQKPGTKAAVINCTFVRDTDSSLSATAEQMNVDYGRPDFENCAFFAGGEGTDWFATSGGLTWETLDYCATDFSALSDLSGEGSLNTYSLTQSDQFESVTGTDWSIKTGNDLGAGGTDKTGTVSLDIWGNSFSANEIGCEAQAAASSTIPPLFHHYDKNLR